MKRLLSYIGAFVLGAIIFGVLGVFFGYEVAQSGTPALLVRNLTDVEVTQVVVHSDREASRPLGSLSPRGFQRVKLPKGDQSIWITVTAAGKTLESEHVYATTGVLVFGAICGEAIALHPAL